MDMPSIFLHDRQTGRVLDRQNPECAWVFAGEGRATQKFDGIACLVRDGALWRRHDCTIWRRTPKRFLPEGLCRETGRPFGWAMVGEAKTDAVYRAALQDLQDAAELCGPLADGTFELLGPKVKGNRENLEGHILLRHDAAPGFDPEPPRSFEGLRAWLRKRDIEGLVFHHPDRRMAKITLRDFGLRRARRGILRFIFGIPAANIPRPAACKR